MDEEDQYPSPNHTPGRAQVVKRQWIKSRLGEGEGEWGTGARAGRRDMQEWAERLRTNGIGTMQIESVLDEVGGEEVQMVSGRPSQEQSANEQGESCHPMILSQINNPHYNHLALLRIRNAASELRQTQLDLADFLDEQALLHQQFIEQLAQDVEAVVGRIIFELQRKAEGEAQQLAVENQGLQERIFDMEQRMVGVELEVDRRLKERGRQAERSAMAQAREESRETIAQLQAEVAVLSQKCACLESQTIPAELRQKEYQISETELALALREESLREELSHLEKRKEAAYQREHELLAGEQNLSKKISDQRKKEAELSEWESELTRKERAVRTVREVTVQSQLEKDLSREQLNHSGQISLKSFGRHHKEEDIRIAPTSLEQLGIHRKRTMNNEEEPQSPRATIQFLRERRQGGQYGEGTHQPRREGLDQGRRFNLQDRGQQGSRETSPYRVLQDLKGRGNGHSHQYLLPKASPREGRDASKNSRTSVSRSRLARVNEGESGLGSKLQRLREEIKKQIESIK